MSFEIVTDSSANLPPEIINQYGIHVVSLTIRADERDYPGYDGGLTNPKTFYDMMRNGMELYTSQINPAMCAAVFDDILSRGNDVLYVGFSSTLSGTLQIALITAEDMSNDYPERQIKVVNTLAASAGEGLLVLTAARMRQKGCCLDEVLDKLNAIKLNVCHWFTVDDLKYLKRGGRISSAASIAGTMLGIKPILHMDNDGKLTPVSKVRGRKAALSALIEKMQQTIKDPDGQTVFIAHADCPEDADFLRNKIQVLYPTVEIITVVLDPVIGSHTGPGTISVYYLGTER